MKNLHDMAIKKVVKAACSLTESLEQYKINKILLCVACRDTGECLILQSNAWAMLGCTYEQKGNLRLKDFRSQHKFCCKKKKKVHTVMQMVLLLLKKTSGTLHKSDSALKGRKPPFAPFNGQIDAFAKSAPISHVSSDALLPAPVAGYVQWSQCKATGEQCSLWPRRVRTAACICPRN